MRWLGITIVACAVIGCGSSGSGGGPGGSTSPGPVPVASDFCSDGWCWVSPKPHGNDLKAAWVDADGLLWTVGAGPIIATWDGSSWTPRVPPDTFHGLLSVWGDGKGQLWVGTNKDRTLWHWNGFTWLEHELGDPSNAYGVSAIHGVSASSIWAGAGQELFHWNGVEWTSVASVASSTSLQAVWASAPDQVWAAAGSAILRGDGLVFSEVPSPTTESLRTMAGTSESDVWVGGDRGAVYTWDGAAWQDRSLPLPADVTDLLVLAPDDVWCTAQGSLPLHWDGNAWTPQEDSALSFAVTRSTGSELLTLGQAGEVKRHDGAGWQSVVDRVEDALLRSVWINDQGQAHIVGDDGFVAKLTGDDVERIDTMTVTDFQAVHGSGPDVWIGGATGPVFKISGQAIETVDPGTLLGGGVVALWSSPSVVWVGGDHDLLAWDGANWSEDDRESVSGLQDLWASAPDDIWTLSDYGIVVRHTTASAQRIQLSARTERGDIGGSGPDDVWVVYDTGKVYRGAQTLTETASPEIPMEVLWVAGPDEVYVGGDEGLARWDGTQWTRTRGIQIQLRDMSGAGAQIWSVGDHGAILRHE